MKKSGLIAGGVAFLFSFGAATIISPICVPCLAFLLGLLAGYLAGVFEKPGNQCGSIKAGTTAGLMGGIGMLLGQILGAILNSALIGPEGTRPGCSPVGFSGWRSGTNCRILLDDVMGTRYRLSGCV